LLARADRVPPVTLWSAATGRTSHTILLLVAGTSRWLANCTIPIQALVESVPKPCQLGMDLEAPIVRPKIESASDGALRFSIVVRLDAHACRVQLAQSEPAATPANPLPGILSTTHTLHDSSTRTSDAVSARAIQTHAPTPS
jgi:hypothetical protein